MTQRSEIRKAEIAVLEQAGIMADYIERVAPPGRQWREIALLEAVQALRALGLADPGRARHSRGAPLTSQMAARWMRGEQAKSLAGQIVRDLVTRPTTGATVPELIERLRRPHQSVSARVNELRDIGWITPLRTMDGDPQTRPGRTGADATVWILSGAAWGKISEATGGVRRV